MIVNLRNLRNLRIKRIRSFQRIELPYGIEGWVREPGVVVRCLLPAARCLLVVLAGMGLAWLLQVLHAGGVTP